MAIKHLSKNGDGKAASRKVSASRSERRSAPVVSGKSVSSERSDDRSKVISTRFHPEAVTYLKDVFGLDLTSSRVPVSALYDIAAGRVTEPLEIVVRPLAYDKAAKKTVEMPPVKAVVSMRFILPYDRKTFKPVAPGKDSTVFVATYPCYEYLQKVDPMESVSADESVRETESGKRELPRFSDAQVMALEGIGIREDRLYAGHFNSLTVDEKRGILSGEAFELNGTVRIADSFDSRLSVNIAGRARMVTDEKGNVRTAFETRYPVEMRNEDVLDLMSVRRVGNIELDFFERDAAGHKKTDVNGHPVINAAGRDLLRYGQCFGPVDGYVHQQNVYNKETGRNEDVVTKDKYQVSVVNGGLCVTRMNKVVELDADGNAVLVTDRSGRQVEKYHYEVKDRVITNEGTLRVGSQFLSPRSDRDLDNFRRGIGGAFEGYAVKDRESGKEKTYTVFATPDNRRNGFPKLFSEEVSKELIARFDGVKKAVRKKQNYSTGLS